MALSPPRKTSRISVLALRDPSPWGGVSSLEKIEKKEKKMLLPASIVGIGIIIVIGSVGGIIADSIVGIIICAVWGYSRAEGE